MSQIKSLLYLLPELFETLFEKVITVAYPFAPLELPANYTGRVRIEADLCRGCGACVRDCPAFGLELEKKGRDEFRLLHYPDRCISCGQCEESCRFKAIRLTNEFVEPSHGQRPSREVLVDHLPDEETDREANEDTPCAA